MSYRPSALRDDDLKDSQFHESNLFQGRPRLPSLSSLLAPQKPQNGTDALLSIANQRKDIAMTSPFDRSFDVSSSRNAEPRSQMFDSSMSTDHTHSPCRVTAGEQRSPRLLSSHFSNDGQDQLQRKVKLSPMRAEQHLGREHAAQLEHDLSPQRESSRVDPYGTSRQKLNGEVQPTQMREDQTLPRAHTSAFDALWDLLLYARRHTDRYERYIASSGPRPLPSIREGDFETLYTHLRYELKILAEHDPQTASEISQEAEHMQNQQYQRPSSIGPRRSSQQQMTQWTMRQEYREASGTAERGPRSGSLPYDARARAYDRSPTTLYPSSQLQMRDDPFQSVHHHQYHLGVSSLPSSSYHLDSHSRISDANMRFISRPGSDHMYPTQNYHVPTYLSSAHSAPPVSAPRRVRKRRDEADQSCLCCFATETPEWRKGPTGPRTLCNACGLLFAKQCRKRELELQAQGKRVKGARTSAADSMTKEERESSLLELQMAVQTRVAQSGVGSDTISSFTAKLPCQQDGNNDRGNGRSDGAGYSGSSAAGTLGVTLGQGARQNGSSSLSASSAEHGFDHDMEDARSRSEHSR